jgi:hypothetical protein
VIGRIASLAGALIAFGWTNGLMGTLGHAISAIPGGAGFISPPEIYRQVASADWAVVTAYELPARGGMTAALSELCRRGRRGDVILAGDRFIVGSSVRSTVDEAAQALREAGCSVRRADAPLHLKLAYVAPGVAYLADRNWGRKATVLRVDSDADRSLIAATLQNRPGTNGELATRKADALVLEAQAITQPSGPLLVESESFGAGTPVYDAILSALAARRSVSLIVASAELRTEGSRSSGGERAALGRLREAGAQVRVGSSNAKMAVGLNGAWMGSTNATAGYPDQIDWGLRITNPALRLQLAQRFASDWASAESI